MDSKNVGSNNCWGCATMGCERATSMFSDIGCPDKVLPSEPVPVQPTVTISREEYDNLIKRDRKLGALQEYGVDNWSGYGDAMQSLEDEDES